MNAFLLIITVGCNAPGSFFVAFNDTNPLYYGFSRGLHVGRRVAKMLNIPGLLVTASAFTYVYSNQLRSMGESALFPTVLRYSYGPDRIPYVALLVGAGLVLGVLWFAHCNVLVLLMLLISAHLVSTLIEVVIMLCFLRLRSRFSSLPRSFRQPLGNVFVYSSIVVMLAVYTPVVALGEHSPYAALGVCNYLVVMTIWYLWQVRSTQKFSPHEQEIMFQAYVINGKLALVMTMTVHHDVMMIKLFVVLVL